MSDIFISYAREDHEAAERLAGLLTAEGWSVWWDPAILPGRAFVEVIDEELAAAKCVIVLWSKDSVGSRWVRAEALEGVDRDILVPIFIENVRPPAVFRQFQAASLIDWDGDTSHEGFRQLIAAVSGHAGVPPQRVEDADANVDIAPWLEALLDRAGYIEISGIGGGVGRTRDASRYPIEQLYTALRSRETAEDPRSRETAEDPRSRETAEDPGGPGQRGPAGPR